MDVEDSHQARELDYAEGDAGGRTQGGEVLRDRVRSYIEGKMSEGGGHAVISTRTIAEQFGVTPTTAAHHVHTLAQMGVISTRSAGRKGLIISVPEPGRRQAQNRMVRAGHAAPTSARAITRAQGGPFCPWCGVKVRKEWHYCNTCGKEL